MSKPDLSVRIGGIRLSNPVLTASGTCGYGREYAPYLDMSRLGGFTTKSVTLQPRKGNPPQRIVETPGGMLNAIGLANVGLDEFMRSKLPECATLGPAVFVNVAGHSIDEYVEVCRVLDTAEGLAGIELNVSCPNVRDGLTFGTDPGLLRELVAAVRPTVTRGVLMVKLSPNVTDICATARAAVEGGADALSMINTFMGMKIDIRSRKPVLANTTGGVSGPAIKPMAVQMIHRVYREVARDAGVQIVGMGGVRGWQDAIEFMLAGATAVAVGTALFAHPDAPMRIVSGIERYLIEQGEPSASAIIGAAHPPAGPARA
ncbi:MAG: dihydroorotate dehydrogenase [Phycisphaerae bacterium]|nr:dihydroorotate dehydrogenase [Phycisphaerae bacterium]